MTKDNKSNLCDECGALFKTFGRLIDHVDKKHPGQYVVIINVKNDLERDIIGKR